MKIFIDPGHEGYNKPNKLLIIKTPKKTPLAFIQP